MKYLFSFFFSLLLGCTHLPEAKDFTTVEVRQYQITDATGADSLVVGEYQGNRQWRWLQMNALGVPLARQIYQDGKWQNDGFLPPNKEARTLFIAIMLADHFGYFPAVHEKTLPTGQQFIFQKQIWLESQPRQEQRLFLKTQHQNWQMKRLN